MRVPDRLQVTWGYGDGILTGLERRATIAVAAVSVVTDTVALPRLMVVKALLSMVLVCSRGGNTYRQQSVMSIMMMTTVEKQKKQQHKSK